MTMPHFDESAQPLGGGRGATSHDDSMSERTTLRFLPPARRDAPATSKAAARSMVNATTTVRARVLDYIASRGPDGAMDDEGEAALGMRAQAYTPRRGELVKLGEVIDSGRTRSTASGRAAIVWIAREHAERGEGAAP